jgi:hypothetical protein
VCQINEDYYENIDAKTIDRVLEELR